MDPESRKQSSQAEPAPEEEVPSLGFPKAVIQISGKGLKEFLARYTITASAYLNTQSALEAKSLHDHPHLVFTMFHSDKLLKSYNLN